MHFRQTPTFFADPDQEFTNRWFNWKQIETIGLRGWLIYNSNLDEEKRYDLTSKRVHGQKNGWLRAVVSLFLPWII